VGFIVEASLEGLFDYYEKMKYFGKYSVFEIDSFLPVEREIKFNLLEKIIKEVSKKQKL